MQTVRSSDGIEIAYEQYGAGPPLLLLHGGPSPRFWEPIIPRFAQDYTVIVPHRRGVADSEDSDSYSLDRGVDDVRSVIDAVDGEPVLFGHSFGGLLAIEAARTAPVRKLVAYEPAVLLEEYRQQADLASQMQSLLDDGDREQAMKHYIREVIHGGDIADLDGWLASWPPWPEITALTENIVRINRAIPNSRLFEFDGLGHSGPTEAPDDVTSVVRAQITEDSIPAPVSGELNPILSQGLEGKQ